MNKTTIKKKHKTHKNNIQYRKLRRWVLPAVLGAALSTLAFIPTFAAETQANTNVPVKVLGSTSACSAMPVGDPFCISVGGAPF